MPKVEECKICKGCFLLDKNGRLIPHRSIKSPDKLCRGVWPKKEYPIGFDRDPWVYNGGLPERNRRKY